MVPLAQIAMDAGQYRPEDFIVPAADEKGHSERQWFRVQPGIDRQLDKIVQGRKFPFRTKGDIIRWSVMLGLQVLESLEPGIPSVLRQVDLIAELVREDQFQQEFENTFQSVSGRVNAHMANGSDGEARKMIARVKSAIDGMPDGAWKIKYQERWRSQFSTYVKSGTLKKGESTGKKSTMMGGSEDAE